MNSVKAPFSYIIAKSNLVYSQKNELSLLVDNLSEEKAEELHEAVKQKTFPEKISCIANFFGMKKLRFNDTMVESGK